MTTLEWAQERLTAYEQPAAGDRQYPLWAEMAAHWRVIVAALAPFPAEPPTEALDNSIVARLKMHVARFRALGGIPEMCKLSWELVTENERLKAELRAACASRTPTEPRPALEQITTFTPLMWMSMTEEQRYEEYIRVRSLLAAPLSSRRTPEPSAWDTKAAFREGFLSDDPDFDSAWNDSLSNRAALPSSSSRPPTGEPNR